MNIFLPSLVSFLIFLIHSSSDRVSDVNGEVQRQTEAHSQYAWRRLTEDAGFRKAYNFQLFSDGEMIFAFHHDGIWVSDSARSWRKTELTNIIRNQGFLDYVKFNGAIYALGTFDGNIERHKQTSQIARTSDFKSWKILADSSNLPRRFFYHPFIFHGKIWIVGGSDGNRTYGDAWTSTDGVTWEKVADHFPFGERAGQHFILFRDSIYMLDRDVWSSADGIRWTQLTPKIADGDIFGYSVEVLDDAIWLIGCNRSGKFDSEVLTSRDGISWHAQHAPWTPRGGVATCVFRGHIIMTGGKYGGQDPAHPNFVYSNDVWSMKKE